MRIERIDDKTVKCFLSMEELEAYDITYKDFILRSEKAREVVEDIILQAGAEVGYKPPQFAMDLQITMIPNHGMVLTFSERSLEDMAPGMELLECLKEVKNILEKKKTGKAEPADKEGELTLDKILDTLGMEVDRTMLSDGEPVNGDKKKNSTEVPAVAGTASESGKKNTPKSEAPQATLAVFAFAGLRDVCEYAKVLPSNIRMKSELYEMNGQYYLFLEKGTASYQRFSRACIQAMEFATLYAADYIKAEYLRENGTCLIAERAVKKLLL